MPSKLYFEYKTISELILEAEKFKKPYRRQNKMQLHLCRKFDSFRKFYSAWPFQICSFLQIMIYFRYFNNLTMPQFTPEQRSFLALEYHKIKGQYSCINIYIILFHYLTTPLLLLNCFLNFSASKMTSEMILYSK